MSDLGSVNMNKWGWVQICFLELERVNNYIARSMTMLDLWVLRDFKMKKRKLLGMIYISIHESLLRCGSLRNRVDTMDPE